MKKITLTQKKWLLTLHILFSAIMLGVTVTFLILSIVAVSTQDQEVLKACYTVMRILSESSVRASTIGTVVTGIMLSVLTNWGLFKFYWIIAKEILTILSIGLGIFAIYFWTLKAVSIVSTEGISALHSPEFIVNRQYLFTGIVLQLISLTAMFALSVFKPWGQRKLRINPKLS